MDEDSFFAANASDCGDSDDFRHRRIHLQERPLVNGPGGGGMEGRFRKKDEDLATGGHGKASVDIDV